MRRKSYSRNKKKMACTTS